MATGVEARRYLQAGCSLQRVRKEQSIVSRPLSLSLSQLLRKDSSGAVSGHRTAVTSEKRVLTQRVNVSEVKVVKV